MKKQVEEAGSRSLVRLMIFMNWLSFVISIWLFYFDAIFGLSAIFWLIATIILVGVLSSGKE